MSEIGYDEATRTLEVAFPPGKKTPDVMRVYAYRPVDRAIYDAIMSAESIGRAFHALIITASVPYERLADAPVRPKEDE